jgi:hypothetical protein
MPGPDPQYTQILRMPAPVLDMVEFDFDLAGAFAGALATDLVAGDFVAVGLVDFDIGDFGIGARVLAWSETGKSMLAACPFIRPVVLSVLLRAIVGILFLPLSFGQARL